MKSLHRFFFAACALFILPCSGWAESSLPPIPQPTTSFGAALSDGWLYVYGGNTGKAHEFNKECVKGDFFRLQVPTGEKWETLPGGLALLSSALVSYEGKIIRLGGMNARNEKGAKNDLHSTDEVKRFDPATGQWEALPSLPEPRSSHDAAVLGHTLYLGGGWKLAGDDGDGVRSKWYDTLLTLDLTAPDKGWQSLPQPFQRRAIAVVAHAHRIWFIGGMNNKDEPSRKVDWFEPATGQWGIGPDLPDGAMGGFGIAACEQGGKLLVSPLSGKVSALSADGTAWEDAGQLNPPRFFHRLLPLTDGRLVAVGGSNKKGQVKELELVALGAPASAPAATPEAPKTEAPKAEAPKIEASKPEATKAEAPKSAESTLPGQAKQPSERGGIAWPQWRGPQRDGISAETGWRKDWPADGPRLLWRAQAGQGMNSCVVADGRLFTHGNDGEGTDSVCALDAATGAELWRYTFPCKSLSHDMAIVPNGPGATPTIFGGRVYTLSREGDLVVLDASTGQLAWKTRLWKDLHGKRPVYGFTQSPLVADGRVFLDIGARPGQVGSTVALDAATGEEKWRAGTGEAGYSSARMFERDGKHLVAMLKGEALNVFDPADGRVFWSYKTTARDFANALTPVFVGHRILVSNTGEPFARLLDWDMAAEPNVREVWSQQQFALLFNNPILLDNALFAFNEKRRDKVEFSCIDAQTGEDRWTSDAVPTGTFILADGHWIFLTRDGEVVLAPASTKELKPIARFKALEGKCYATPTLANGRLYVKNNAGEIAAYDLRPTSAPAASSAH